MPASPLPVRDGRGLDWLNFLVANLQTGFGPFIAVYLTTHRWTQVEIGIALSVGSLVSMLGQVPAGALVDALQRKRAAVTGGLVMVGASALLLAIWPERLPVYVAQSLHAFASCALGPAIAAISLNRVLPQDAAERLGRNARYAALGNAAGAALMGASGAFLSSRAVFVLAALLCLPAIAAVRALPAPRGLVTAVIADPRVSPWSVLRDRRLLAFAICVVMFHLTNAAMLPIAAAEVTRQAGDAANLVIAASLVVPQGVVALLSPMFGRAAERWGRRPVLVLGFAALPLRALLFATIADAPSIVGVQALDGVSGAVFGVMLPLVAADLTRGTGRFNLCLGILGLATGLGATLSTTVAGGLAAAFGPHVAFLALAVSGTVATLLVLAAMPETRPPEGLGG
jgi:MFS family permease